MITYTPTEAETMGYVPVTTPYEHSEKDMFERALDQMKGTDHLVVLDRLRRPEIYRKKVNLNLRRNERLLAFCVVRDYSYSFLCLCNLH